MSQLDEGYDGNAHLDPLAANGVNDFDWPDLYSRLGESDALNDGDLERLGQALRSILGWATEGINPPSLDRVARRIFILAWSLRPDEFAGGKSLRALSKEMGVSAALLSCHDVRRVRESFGLRNRFAAHDWRGRINHDQAKETPAGGFDADGSNHHGGCECDICLEQQERDANGS